MNKDNEIKFPILNKLEGELGEEVVSLVVDYIQELHGATFDMTKVNLEMDLASYTFEKQVDIMKEFYYKRMKS